MRRNSNSFNKIQLTALFEQIRPSFGTAKPHLQRLQEAPLLVQVPLPKYRIAQDIFNTLHIGTGTRIDVNIWKFQSSEDLESFIDSLFMLGFEEKDVIYPTGFLSKIKDETGEVKSKELSSEDTQDLDALESDLETESDVDFDQGFETSASEEESNSEESSDDALEEDLFTLEDDMELDDLESALTNEPEDEYAFDSEKDLTQTEEDVLSELDEELAQLESELEDSKV